MKMPTEGIDFFIRIVHFPNPSTPAQLWINQDGTFDIYIDDRCCYAGQLQAALHEINHIRLAHFDSLLPIECIEKQANDTGDLYDLQFLREENAK